MGEHVDLIFVNPINILCLMEIALHVQSTILQQQMEEVVSQSEQLVVPHRELILQDV